MSEYINQTSQEHTAKTSQEVGEPLITMEISNDPNHQPLLDNFTSPVSPDQALAPKIPVSASGFHEKAITNIGDIGPKQ